MLESLERKEHIRNLIIITVAYLLTHGFILVLTGTWWDEKTWAFASDERMWETSMMLGRPTTYFLMKFIFGIPEPIARLVIFLCFYIGTLGIYYIFNHLPLIPAKYTVWLTLIYNAIPVNDARAMRGVFPYTFGYMMFILAFCALVILQTKYEYKNIPFRLLVLLLFACSFILNSNLVFYGLAIMYISYYVYQNGELNKIYKYADFIVIPILYFGLKTHFFPAYGTYEGYNAVSLGRSVRGIYITAQMCIENFIEIFQLWLHCDLRGLTILVGLFLVIYFGYRFFVYKRRGCFFSMNNSSMNDALIIVAVGILAMYLGEYAYCAVGQWFHLAGPGGRNAVLFGIGSSIIIFMIISSISVTIIRYSIFVIAILCGIIHFNMFYLSYQQDYYRQQDLVHEMRQNQNILAQTKNIFYLTPNESMVNVTCFYSLNSNGREAFGDESHFFMNRRDDIAYLKGTGIYDIQMFVHGGDYQMADYDVTGSKEIEAVVVYNNDLNLKKTMGLKFDELFNHDSFEERIFEGSNLAVYTPDMPRFDELVSTIMESKG
ncbi:hypothetical protein [Anaerovibrio sp.]|uniref:hypothetical protein n=1 Tax=Anaerovibrio sp. TaxID=1872532 RepID=UPI00388D3810